jgi:hypothetical protein
MDARFHLINPTLQKCAWDAFGTAHEPYVKQAFVQPPGGDPSGGMGAGGGAPAAGPPIGDPSGGANPGGGLDAGMLRQVMTEVMQQHAMQMGGGAGGAGGPNALKPKIDVNVEMMQIKNMLAKICDTLGIQIPAQDMVATPDKLQAMAQGQPTATQMPGGAGGQQGQSAIQPMGQMDPMQGAFPGGQKSSSYSHEQGFAFHTSELGAAATAADVLRRHLLSRAS